MKRLIAFLLLIGTLASLANGLADEKYYSFWVICNAESYVNIRSEPKKSAEQTGYALTCWELETDGKQRNGYLHVVGVTENGSGWISTHFVVYDEPTEINKKGMISATGRVAARYSIDGKRSCWLKPGAEVFVSYISSEWAYTNRGWVKTEYIHIPGNVWNPEDMTWEED